MLSITDSDILIEALNNNLKFLHDNFIPIRKRIEKVNPWFNREIEIAIIARDIAYSNWKQSRSEQEFGHFKNLRNRVNLLIRDAKRRYDRRKFQSNLPSKHLWANIKKTRNFQASFIRL